MISIFTPTNGTPFFQHTVDSVLTQVDEDWEWVVLLNGLALDDPDVLESLPADPRILVHGDKTVAGNVGAAKAAAVAECSGDIFLELDHDDLLHPNAVSQVRLACERFPGAALISSYFWEIDENGEELEPRWNQWAAGGMYDGNIVKQPALVPHNIATIHRAPNHLRAFPRWAYEKAGGYDVNRKICDDQDLMLRLHAQGPYSCIPLPLYSQRIHAAQTQADPAFNPQIQRDNLQLHRDQIMNVSLDWAFRNDLMRLDLGAAHGHDPRFVGVDLVAAPGVGIVGDIFDILENVATGSIGVVRAVDFIEHLPLGSGPAFFNLLHDKMAHGGMFLSLTPSTDGRGAFCDPTHTSFWNELSFRYYTEPVYRAYIPEVKGPWVESLVETFYPSPWHEQRQVPYVRAHMTVDKGESWLGV